MAISPDWIQVRIELIGGCCTLYRWVGVHAHFIQTQAYSFVHGNRSTAAQSQFNARQIIPGRCKRDSEIADSLATRLPSTSDNTSTAKE